MCAAAATAADTHKKREKLHVTNSHFPLFFASHLVCCEAEGVRAGLRGGGAAGAATGLCKKVTGGARTVCIGLSPPISPR